MAASRPVAFVLASTEHGPLLVNRFDRHETPQWGVYGVGHQLLSQSAFDPAEVRLVTGLLERRRRHFGDGVVAIDGGANIGVHTVEWARRMHGWGSVLAFEAQEVVFYALAGNIALNNCLNARARLAALGEHAGEIAVPQPDYTQPASFGSLELRRGPDAEFIGQALASDPADSRMVPVVCLDDLSLERLDFLKLDVEGMELDVLRGARKTIARHRPALLVETIKSDTAAMQALLDGLDYVRFASGINWVAVHGSDPMLGELLDGGAEPL